MSREEWEENEGFEGKYEGKDGTFVVQYQDDDSWTVEFVERTEMRIGGNGVGVKGDTIITGSQYLEDEEGKNSWDTMREAITVTQRHAGVIPPKPLADRRGLVAHSRALL